MLGSVNNYNDKDGQIKDKHPGASRLLWVARLLADITSEIVQYVCCIKTEQESRVTLKIKKILFQQKCLWTRAHFICNV